MGAIYRGAKNAFRNKLRTGAVVFILAIGIGLALSMLVANKAVANKIADLKASMGTALTINPAGARGFQGGGEPLTTADVTKVKDVAHVSSVVSSLNVRLTKAGSESAMPFGLGGNATTVTTSLDSSIEPGTLGNRMRLRSGDSGSTPTMQVPTNFTLPVMATGVSTGTSASGEALKITSGRTLKSGDTHVAVIGKALAEKNNLKVSSTFTINDTTIQVVGVYDGGSEFENGGLYLPLADAQSFSQQSGEVSLITALVDSLDNVDATKSAIQQTLGSDKADVSSVSQGTETAISSLQSVQKISIIAFAGTVIAAGVVIFLIMVVIVRERRREIGVLKAIGGSNRRIVTQFIAEAMVLVMLATAVGIGFAFMASSSVANVLVSSNTSEQSESVGMQQVGPGAARGRIMLNNGLPQSTSKLIGDVTTSIGAGTLAGGLVAIFIIAGIGSALPAWAIAKIRPAEVLRGE